MTVELYKGKSSPHYVAAHDDGVRGELAKTALKMGIQARGILAAHHGQTAFRRNANPPPTIRIEAGKLDYYVILEAQDEDGGLDLQRAIGIEFGHRYQSRMKNRTGPWGESGGLHIFDRIMDGV